MSHRPFQPTHKRTNQSPNNESNDSGDQSASRSQSIKANGPHTHHPSTSQHTNPPLYKAAGCDGQLPLFLPFLLLLLLLCFSSLLPLLALHFFLHMVSSLLAFDPMGFFVVDDASSSGVILSHVLYKAAFVIALMRWVVFWALRLRQTLSSSSASSTAEEGFDFPQAEYDKESCSSSSSASTHLIRDCLIQTTFGEITERRGSYGSNGGGDCDTCAVCLSQLEMRDEVREMRNCCHVFHTECIDRWLEYNDDHHHHHHRDNHDEDNHKTCPLCRTPLLTPSQIQSLSWDQSRSQPSWAVERLLHLFGDDLEF